MANRFYGAGSLEIRQRRINPRIRYTIELRRKSANRRATIAAWPQQRAKRGLAPFSVSSQGQKTNHLTQHSKST